METIKCAAIRIEKIVNGKTVKTVYSLPRPARHGDIYDFIYEKCPDELIKTHHVEGFLTDSNRFVTRYDASRIAERAKQIISKVYSKDCLYSEDLW